MGFDTAESGRPRYNGGNGNNESITLDFARHVRAKSANMNLFKSDKPFSQV